MAVNGEMLADVPKTSGLPMHEKTKILHKHKKYITITVYDKHLALNVQKFCNFNISVIQLQFWHYASGLARGVVYP